MCVCALCVEPRSERNELREGEERNSAKKKDGEGSKVKERKKENIKTFVKTNCSLSLQKLQIVFTLA